MIPFPRHPKLIFWCIFFCCFPINIFLKLGIIQMHVQLTLEQRGLGTVTHGVENPHITLTPLKLNYSQLLVSEGDWFQDPHGHPNFQMLKSLI